MRVFFSGSPEAAEAARTSGFSDADLSIGGQTFAGVWLSNEPQGARLAAEVRFDDLEVFEVVDARTPYREFLVPAGVLAGYRFEQYPA